MFHFFLSLFPFRICLTLLIFLWQYIVVFNPDLPYNLGLKVSSFHLTRRSGKQNWFLGRAVVGAKGSINV